MVIFVIAFTSWTYMARIVRGQTLSLREKEFVEAARAAGASNTRIIFREILPNLTAPIIVYASILIPQVILYEAALSFLGVGVNDRPSWGQMISDATPIFSDAWWYMLFPGVALLLTVLAFNLVGDAMQDALNPRGRSEDLTEPKHDSKIKPTERKSDAIEVARWLLVAGARCSPSPWRSPPAAATTTTAAPSCQQAAPASRRSSPRRPPRPTAPSRAAS